MAWQGIMKVILWDHQFQFSPTLQLRRGSGTSAQEMEQFLLTERESLTQDAALFSMWTESPQGMHVTLHLNGSVFLNRLGATYSACQTSCESCEFCDVSLYFLFSIPSGVYIDPFELQVWLYSPYLDISQARHDFLYDDVLVSLPPTYLTSFSPEPFAEKSSSFWLGVELFHLPINLETLTARFSFDLPLHLRYHSSFLPGESAKDDSMADSILSLIEAPEIFVGEYEPWEGWKPGIWIDFGEPSASDPSLPLVVMADTLRNSQRHAMYHQALPLTPLCGCLGPFLSSSLSHSFSLASLSLLSSDCSQGTPSDSLVQLSTNPLCSPRVSLAMPFPFGLSSGLVILVTALVISLTTIALGGVLIQQKRREAESESYRER
jgi:hypothetical protein